MNFLLQFKDKKHAEAYSHDTQLQVNKRLAMVVTWTALNILGNSVFVAMYKQVHIAHIDIAKITLLATSIITLIIVKCYFRRVQKYLRVINFVLDIFLIFVMFFYYPWLGAEATDVFGKLGVFVMAWSTCLATHSICYFLMSWWLRALFPLGQMCFFLVFVVQREFFPNLIIVFAVECMSMYLFYIYIHERYQRIDFLGKRRVFENYEAIKKIFDDIIQGMMIVDQKYNIVYTNQTVYTMFNYQQDQLRQDGPSVRALFSQIYVKTILPRIELSASDRIRTALESEEDVTKYFATCI